MYVSKISIYPIKSLGGITLRDSLVGERGLRNDRRLMLVDENHELITQRDFPKLATLKVSLHEDHMRVSSTGVEPIDVPAAFDPMKIAKVRVWQSVCTALVAEDVVNMWFSEVIGANCSLVRMPATTRRQINERFNQGDEIVSFADGYPVLVIGEESLNDLNSRLPAPVPMDRFRPNIVVSGSGKFEEDRWKRIRIGSTIFRAAKPCARCVVTTIDQETGISDVKEPLKTLAGFRKSDHVFPDNFEEMGLSANDVLFGQNLVPETFGQTISVGDEVRVVE